MPPEIRRLSEMEIGFMRRRNTAITALLAGEPVAPDALETISLELLPQCRRARESLQSAEIASRAPGLTPLLTQYVELHEEAWQALARALQSRDLTAVHRHERLVADAERLIHELSPAAEHEGAGNELRRFHDLVLSLTPRVWAIPLLVWLNVLVWIAMVVNGAGPLNPPIKTMIEWGANYGPLTLGDQWWRIVTCMFLHFGLLHIGFNMYVLWHVGDLVERLVGNVGLLILYLASGVAASIASLAWNSQVVSAGASGAVFGVCGALLGFIVLRRDTIPKAVLMDLKSSLVTFVVYNVAFGLVVPAIDMAAHLGGLAYGALCGVLLSQPLVPDARARRWRKNLVCLIAAAGLLPLGYSFLPDGPPDLDATLASIRQTDQAAVALYQQLDRQWRQGQIEDEEYAKSVTRQLVPLYDRALVDAKAVHTAPNANPRLILSIERYLALRRESLLLLDFGVRNVDRDAMQRHRLSWLQANIQQRQLFPARQNGN